MPCVNRGMTDFLLAVLCSIFDLQNSSFYAKERKGAEELLCYVSARQASEISVVTVRERERESYNYFCMEQETWVQEASFYVFSNELHFRFVPFSYPHLKQNTLALLPLFPPFHTILGVKARQGLMVEPNLRFYSNTMYTNRANSKTLGCVIFLENLVIFSLPPLFSTALTKTHHFMVMWYELTSPSETRKNAEKYS